MADAGALQGIREMILGGDLQRSLVQPLAQSGHHNFVQPNLETLQEWRYFHFSGVQCCFFTLLAKKVIPEVQPEPIKFFVTPPATRLRRPWLHYLCNDLLDIGRKQYRE